MKIINRTFYIDILKGWKDKHVIKVITGMRRSGKTTIMHQFMETLKDENVIEFDFNNIFMKKVSYIELQELIVSKADDKKTNYLFLDEVQEIENFEKCIVNLFEHRTIKFDIYITGSNSKMFSSSLTALFTGKNIEIKVFPLSFKEYFSYCKERNGNIQKLECFLKYVEYGGLPIILDYVDKEDNTRKIIEKVLADSVEIDVKRRHQIKTNAFQNLLKYIYAHVGQVISGINIANFLKSNVEAINYKTIMRYIGWLEEAFLIYKCPISSITGKRLLLQNNKYYASDTGVRNVECGKENTNRGSLLENIVLFELLRKNFRVVTGKLKDGKEINFVASKEGWEIYIQVTEKIDWDIESKNYKRDIGNLRSVRNNFPKVVISLYDESGVLMNGVMVINIVEWTLGENKYVVI